LWPQTESQSRDEELDITICDIQFLVILYAVAFCDHLSRYFYSNIE
jgi:hypothetical protein